MYCDRKSVIEFAGARSGNRAAGIPISRLLPGARVAAISFRSAETKKISRPSARNCGWSPPPVETCHFAPVGGNVWTYTSARPVSSEA